jgi:phosphoribosylaminoimidazole-succinocarboxamide synthase
MSLALKRKLIYEGKAKILFEGPEEDTIIQHFKDDATAFNNQKKGTIPGKGVINNRISEYIMVELGEAGVPTHFLRTLNMREQLVRKVDIIPVEVVVRNVAAGGLSKRLGLDEGTVLPRPIVEFYYKKDELGDPLVSDDTIIAFGWADQMQIEEMRGYAYRVNDFLRGLFRGVGIRLIDFKLEFGRFMMPYEQLLVADEISPDNCRLWDYKTNEKLDKDRFRHDLGGVEEAYLEVARRLGVISGALPPEAMEDKDVATLVAEGIEPQPKAKTKKGKA